MPLHMSRKLKTLTRAAADSTLNMRSATPVYRQTHASSCFLTYSGCSKISHTAWMHA